MSSAWVGVTGTPGSVGTVSQSTYVWPVHVACPSPSMVAGFQGGTAGKETCQENECEEQDLLGLRVRNHAVSLPLVTNGSLRSSRFLVGESAVR